MVNNNSKMKRTIQIGLIALLFLAHAQVVAAQTETPPAPAPVEPVPTATAASMFAYKPLCYPEIYLFDPVDCLPLGQSARISEMASKGFILPLPPLPLVQIDPSLTDLDQKYARLNIDAETRAAYYPNIDSAIAGVNPLHTLPAGRLLYITYKHVSYVNNKPYLQNERQEWIRATPVKYSTFQGLQFARQPSNAFGWIVDTTQARNAPSYKAALVKGELKRETVVQVYDSVEAEKTTWHMVGLGKWVEHRYIRVIHPRTSPPDKVENGRWIEINLFEQTISVYQDNQLVFATLAATGVEPYYTQPGLFQITEKKPLETMTGAFEAGKADFYYLENVPWTMYFDQKRAIHGAYWRAMFGYEQSHGCVNVSVGDSRWLYDWAKTGDWVYVWDPSGKTPTDPALYGAGGA